MNKTKYFLALLACIPVFFLVGKGMSIIDSSGYAMKSKKSSPSGQYTVYEIQSVSQEGPAPHGRHLVLSDKEFVQKPEDGEVIFAGYCHPPFDYSWKSDRHIIIQCQPKEKEAADPQARTKTVQGIQVEIQYVQ